MTSEIAATLLAVVLAATSPQQVRGQTPSEPMQEAPAVPFAVGELASYDVRFGSLKVGSGAMEVVGIETVRNRKAWHIAFRLKGGTFMYKVNDVFESWMDVQTLSSLRYHSDQEEGGRDREKKFEIFPERRVFIEQGKPEQPSVAQPLDDGNFFYFVRTLQLEVGRTYEFHRYFRPDRNPVTIRVLRKERITVPAGTYDAIVLQPVIKTKGIFSENGHAEVWLADDSTRVLLQLKSRLKFGSLNLYLRSYRRSTPAKP